MDFLCTGTSQSFYTHELAGFSIYLSKIFTLPQDAYIFLNYVQTRIGREARNRDGDWGQGTGDNEQRRKTVDKGRETEDRSRETESSGGEARIRDVRQGTEDGR